MLLINRYQKLLFKAANSTQSETPYSFVAEFSKKVDAANLNFKQLARRYIDKAIPDVDISEAAQSTLMRAGAFHETANVKLTTYVQMVSKLNTSAEQFKDGIQARIAADEKDGKITTVTDLKSYINEELKSGHGVTVRYSNGADMPVDKYAEMLARTTRTETHNIAMLGKALDDGNDLVECSIISPTCPTCAMYQGRIYSISGNTPGYPALYETAFKNGYSCIHPNCRHQFFPYNPKFHTEIKNKRFLNIVHQTLYDFVLFVSLKSWRRAVIEKYREELEEPIKDILLSIAYAIDTSGQFNGLWDGVTKLDSGEFKVNTLQERLTAVIPPMTWNQILGLEPNVMFMGGEI